VVHLEEYVQRLKAEARTQHARADAARLQAHEARSEAEELSAELTSAVRERLHSHHGSPSLFVRVC